jgi:uncharacterized protein (TIGR02757 family)
VAGIVASSLAFGNAKTVIRSARAVLDVLGERPSETIRDGRKLRPLARFRHRWVSGRDVILLLRTIGRIQAGSGTLEAFFLEGRRSGDPDVGPALSRFTRRVREMAGGTERGFLYLLSDPATGSAAKRLCLYLRWMVRPDDGLDLGVWSGVAPGDLVIPLDTHVLRISRYIGLTTRRTAGFATAREITRALATFCPEDPVRYDFALAQLGISKGCLHRRDERTCPVCPLNEVCRL